MTTTAEGLKIAVTTTDTADDSISERTCVALPSNISSEDQEYAPWARCYTPVLVHLFYRQTYGFMLGDAGGKEDSGSGGSSAPIIILEIRYLTSQFNALSTGDSTQKRICTAWPSRTPQHLQRR